MPSVNRSLPVTLLIRSATAANWLIRNPILQLSEFGLETDTFYIKVGDGIHDWEHLPYLNQLDSTYFKRTEMGYLTFSDSFAQTINNIIANAGGDAHLVIADDPTLPTDPVNLRYLEWAIAHAGHLKREVVENLPATIDADENTLYMILAPSGDYYEEYMIINGTWDKVGETGDGGSGGGFQLEVATHERLGGVRSSTDPNYIAVDQNTGYMSLNQVSTSLLYVPTGDTLTLNGGGA